MVRRRTSCARYEPHVKSMPNDTMHAHDPVVALAIAKAALSIFPIPVAPPPAPAPAPEPASKPAATAALPVETQALVLSKGAGVTLCVSGLLLELLVFLMPVLAVQAGTGAWATGLGLLFHASGCFLMARGLYALMPPIQQTVPRLGPLFLFTMMFFIPLLGFIGLVGSVLFELHHPRKPEPPSPWLHVPIPELPNRPSLVSARPAYGDGALSAMLRYCPDPERRLAAVLAVRHLRDANDAKVLRLALTDAVDDVRLLSYSILDRKEQAFNARLKSLADELRGAKVDADSQRCATLEKRLAQTHFEMIELGLCQGEVQNYMLTEAHRHVEAALQIDPDDRESLFLLGSIALRQDDLDVAEGAFLKAQVKGMSLENVLPHLAELAFRQKRFAMVTNYLRAIEPIYFRAQPRLSGVALHWLKEERACLPKRLPT
jgi:hypothetical protein